MTFKLYSMAVEAESYFNRKHNVVKAGVMTLRASNEVVCHV